jgi:hypothetical protein
MRARAGTVSATLSASNIGTTGGRTAQLTLTASHVRSMPTISSFAVDCIRMVFADAVLCVGLKSCRLWTPI